MTLLLLGNLGFAGGGAVVPLAAFGDLTFLFSGYLNTLDAAHAGADDHDTLVMKAQPAVRAATHSDDDLNTAYCEYLS